MHLKRYFSWNFFQFFNEFYKVKFIKMDFLKKFRMNFDLHPCKCEIDISMLDRISSLIFTEPIFKEFHNSDPIGSSRKISG